MAMSAADERTVVVIAADSRVRQALGALVAATSGLRLITAASSPAAALDAVEVGDPDAAVVDVSVVDPGPGLAAIGQLSPLMPVIAVVAASSHRAPALAAGACAACDADGDADALSATVRAAAERPAPHAGGRPTGRASSLKGNQP